MSLLPFVQRDLWLQPFADQIHTRLERVKARKRQLLPNHDTQLNEYANGHHYFGLHETESGWVLREWAPNASGIWLVSERTKWEANAEYAFQTISPGVWELQLKKEKLRHLEQYKLWVTWSGGADFRLPLWANRVIQDEESKLFNAQVYVTSRNPSIWVPASSSSNRSRPLMIYEAHIGMSSAEGKVNTFKAFRTDVLPRIHSLGYNTLQLMAIQEHPYYGSFGYHVSNFFAVSSRFGTPDDLIDLIQEAHRLGIRVIMDLVHSHAVKNTLEGPGCFDGDPGFLFHTDHRREHPAWDSLCFNYGKDSVIHFLLSNCKYWLEKYGFDGFRFDGVTSMLYTHHGLGYGFSNYNDYFNDSVDQDALTYLALANELIHSVNPHAITVAEEMSGMPGLAIPTPDGGIGFDYRLAMGIPDFWIKLLKEKNDEQWNVNQIFWELINRRDDEKTVSYAESHDQALVGDKTIIFRLADKEMYDSMSASTSSIVIDRALALHKMIRLVTAATHGGAYLNFMGNEFGHPEWIDFPREGNNWSFHYARRQWQLVDDPELKYRFLAAFDRSMIKLLKEIRIPNPSKPELILANEGDQVLAFSRDSFLFVFNFHPTLSFTDYGINSKPTDYKVVLNSDQGQFGGFDRVDTSRVYPAHPIGKVGAGYQLKLYLPSRTALVFKELKTPSLR